MMGKPCSGCGKAADACDYCKKQRTENIILPYTARGSTYVYRDILSAAGFQFDARVKVWRHPGISLAAVRQIEKRTSKTLVLSPVRSCKPGGRSDTDPAR